MRNSVLSAPSALLVVILLFPGVAIAQAPILTADCTQDAGCLTLKEQAAEHSRSGDLVEALRLYKLAYEVRPDPRLLFNIARLLHKQGKPGESVPYYQKFIDAPIQDEEEQQQKAREYLEQIRAAALAQKPTKKSSSDPTTGLPAETPRVDAPPAKKPVYKTLWFWAVVGSSVMVASAVTAGIIVGTSAAQSANERVLPANTAMFMF